MPSRVNNVKKKVVLFYPPYDGPPLGAPLCMLALASPLLQAGFEVKLVDNLTSPDYEEVILREIDDALCLGISVLTGPMIGSAARIARKVKKARPELPLFWEGGIPAWFPIKLSSLISSTRSFAPKGNLPSSNSRSESQIARNGMV